MRKAWDVFAFDERGLTMKECAKSCGKVVVVGVYQRADTWWVRIFRGRFSA